MMKPIVAFLNFAKVLKKKGGINNKACVCGQDDDDNEILLGQQQANSIKVYES